MAKKEIDFRQYLDAIEDGSADYYKYLILGQQVYRTVLYAYIFSNITQNKKICHRLVKVPKEDILIKYLNILEFGFIWDARDNGLNYKIQKSFAVIGLQYRLQGYDSAYSTMRQVADSYYDSFLHMPVTNYTQMLESYAWNYHHIHISYAVEVGREFSVNDVEWKASITFQGKEYSSIGYSKKNAVEHLSRKIVFDAIPDKDRIVIASSQGFTPIKKERLQIDPFEYTDANEKVSAFANKYGMDNLLLRIALSNRSQFSEDYLTHMGIIQTISTKEASVIQKCLIEWGRELLLLLVLDYCINNHIIDSVDLSLFNEMNINLGRAEIHKQMEKLFHLDSFSLLLFEESSVPIQESLIENEKYKIEFGIISSFFLSNFAPEKKFIQYFKEFFDSFYLRENGGCEIDYRFATLAHLSGFNIKAETNHHEVDGGLFHAEVTIGSPEDNLRFVYENESMQYAKEEVWHLAYESVITSVKKFFETAYDCGCPDAIIFFVHNVCKKSVISYSLLAGYGILYADSFSRISLDVCAFVLEKARNCIDAKTLSEFLNIVYKANSGKYVCFDNHVYSYYEWMQYSNGGNAPKDVIKTGELSAIYDGIVNPSSHIQKRIIAEDYRNVKRITPLSETIAIYALDESLDAYNYLPFISSSVEAYYIKLKAEKTNLSDIGLLSTCLEDGVTVYIMDSQKSVHSQLFQMISSMRINRISIACGYCFASGLTLLKDILQRELNNGTPIELYVGSLQNYDEFSDNNLITSIDKSTVRIINQYLSFSNFKLFTCHDRFYHGKLYIFECDKESIVIVGSSNVSRSAFISNYELNIAFRLPNGSALLNNFIDWKNQLKHYSKRIEKLHEEMFGNNEIKLDGSILVKHVSTSTMTRRIRELTNTEVQYRLSLWMSYSPDVIAEDLGILALPNYFVFVYRKYGLIVLESFEAGNAYFCLKSKNSFEDVINLISTFSKTEIFEFSRMAKRGYHVSNKFTLESNIRWYFKE